MLCCAASANVDILWTSAVLDHFTQKWKQGFGLRKLSQRYFGGDNTSVLSYLFYYLIYLNSLYTLYTPVKLLDQSYVHNQKKLKTTVWRFNYGTEYLTVMWRGWVFYEVLTYWNFPTKLCPGLTDKRKRWETITFSWHSSDNDRRQKTSSQGQKPWLRLSTKCHCENCAVVQCADAAKTETRWYMLIIIFTANFAWGQK